VRRPPRQWASVGRSLGAAESNSGTGLSQTNVTRFLAVACICALAWIPVTAGAQSTRDRVIATRNAIDATAQRWFAAQDAEASINARIGEVEHALRRAEARVASVRVVATARAVDFYKGASVNYTGVIGSTAIDSARRAELIDTANAKSEDAINALTSAVAELKAQRRELLRRRADEEKAIHAVGAERTALDHQLASLRADLGPRPDAAGVALTTDASPTTDVFAAPTSPAPAPVAIAAPAPPANDGRVSPHHNDPFLVCTRAHESNGQYGVVSPAGYYGAYQFAPSTWDTTAVHAGRDDLIGVLPSRASPYDQDEMAWALYRWQGNAPWGGRC
jgi:septal ring factor EnvC (AmiA/AmiB activator)